VTVRVVVLREESGRGGVSAGGGDGDAAARWMSPSARRNGGREGRAARFVAASTAARVGTASGGSRDGDGWREAGQHVPAQLLLAGIEEGGRESAWVPMKWEVRTF
jgi:hypothetical protein